MKKLLNTLYIMTQGAYLSREGETVHVNVDKETRLRVPIHTLDGIVCMGQVSCSTPLLGLCAERNVSVSFMSEQGKFLARVLGPVSGNVLLRREQYRKADDEKTSAEIARWIVTAKVANSRTVLLRASRENRETCNVDQIENAAAKMLRVLEELRNPMSLVRVRGCEGEAANIYFGVFNELITLQKDDFQFKSRNRRPPLDRVNALLSFIYTLLAHDATSALEGVGLDPAVGFLHRDRPGRPSLALDLMEELRACFADRLALTLINRQQVRGKEFRETETGAVLMDDTARKTLLISYQKRKMEKIQHPFLEENVPVGLLFHAQALLLSRFIRGDMDAYPPYFWK